MIIDQLFKDASKKNLNEVDPRNFDSDEDFYAAQNAPAKPRYRGQQSPGVNPDDEAYFREIFRKKREAAKKAEQDKDQGVEEGRYLDSIKRAARRLPSGPRLARAGRAIKTIARALTPSTASTVPHPDGLGYTQVPIATGAINPATGQAYTPDEMTTAYYDIINKRAARDQAANVSDFAPPEISAVTSKPISQDAIDAAQQSLSTSATSYGRRIPGYNYTTSVTPTATPAKTGPSGTYNKKTGAATLGGVTQTALSDLPLSVQQRIRDTQPVSETVKQVKRMLETVTSKDDVQRIKNYLNKHLGPSLSENVKRNRDYLISEATQLVAIRRRDIARRLAQ